MPRDPCHPDSRTCLIVTLSLANRACFPDEEISFIKSPTSKWGNRFKLQERIVCSCVSLGEHYVQENKGCNLKVAEM